MDVDDTPAHTDVLVSLEEAVHVDVPTTAAMAEVAEKSEVPVELLVDDTPEHTDVLVSLEVAAAVDVPTTPTTEEVDDSCELPLAVDVLLTPVKTEVPVRVPPTSSSGKKKSLKTTSLTGSSLYQLTCFLAPSAHSGRSSLILIDYPWVTIIWPEIVARPVPLANQTRNGVVLS